MLSLAELADMELPRKHMCECDRVCVCMCMCVICYSLEACFGVWRQIER